VSNSPFKTQQEAFDKYKELVEAYLMGNNKWKDWESNDPIFQTAKKSEKYKSLIEELDSKMDAYDEENE